MPPTSTRPVKRALLSVSDKSGLIEFGRGLADLGVEPGRRLVGNQLIVQAWQSGVPVYRDSRERLRPDISQVQRSPAVVERAQHPRPRFEKSEGDDRRGSREYG